MEQLPRFNEGLPVSKEPIYPTEIQKLREQSEIECVDTKKSTTPNFFEMVLFTWYQNDTFTAKPPLKK